MHLIDGFQWRGEFCAVFHGMQQATIKLRFDVFSERPFAVRFFPGPQVVDVPFRPSSVVIGPGVVNAFLQGDLNRLVCVKRHLDSFDENGPRFSVQIEDLMGVGEEIVVDDLTELSFGTDRF